ncbi:MAG: tetratricopeptide repeat protein [Sphingomonas sp.]
MTTDRDILAALPEPPPPRPARRDAAIEAALRRFDEGGAPDRPRAVTPASWRGRIVRPQFAAFATVALVALIGLPVWMSGDHSFSSVSREAPASVAPSANPRDADSAAAAAEQHTVPPSLTLAAPSSPVASPRLETAPANPPSPMVAERSDARSAANMAQFSAPQAQAVQESRPDKDFAAKRQQNRLELADAAAPPPPPPAPSLVIASAPPPSGGIAGRAVADASLEADIGFRGTRVSKSSSADLVVTAQRRSAAKPSGRGDWNACTVNDPSHRVSACGALFDPAAPGPDGRAAAHIADGLSLAWQDDLDGAIAAFDQAITISPRLSFAYLNRGLAFAHKRELKRALADLDQAIRYAPNAARTYYNRSLVWRQRGDSRRAEADEARAIALDQRYAALIR